jgi:hypothetical protein
MECIYIGYTENYKAYCLYHKHSRRVFESWDVTFNEGIGQTSCITIEVGPPHNPLYWSPQRDCRGRSFIWKGGRSQTDWTQTCPITFTTTGQTDTTPLQLHEVCTYPGRWWTLWMHFLWQEYRKLSRQSDNCMSE